jgi:hypothetical protein
MMAPTNVEGQANLRWVYTLIKTLLTFQPTTKRYCQTKIGQVK